MLIIGEKEQSDGKVSVRKQGKGDEGSIDVDQFINNLKQEISSQRDH